MKVGMWLYRDGRYAEAELLSCDVMKINRGNYGVTKLSTLAVMNWIAPTYVQQGRLKESEELGLRVLGLKHSNTLTSMSILAHAWKSLGMVEDALMSMKTCVELGNEKLSPGHPDTITFSKTLSKCQVAYSSLLNKPSQTLVKCKAINILNKPQLNIPADDKHAVDEPGLPFCRNTCT